VKEEWVDTGSAGCQRGNRGQAETRRGDGRNDGGKQEIHLGLRRCAVVTAYRQATDTSPAIVAHNADTRGAGDRGAEDVTEKVDVIAHQSAAGIDGGHVGDALHS